MEMEQEKQQMIYTLTPWELAACAIGSMGAMQKQPELAALLELVSSGSPEIIIEIGVGKGGTAWAWSKIPSVKKLILIDLPDGPWGGGPEEKTIKYIADNSQAEVIFIKGHSQNAEMLKAVSVALNGESCDFLMIDGDHSAVGVAADYEMYKDFVRDGGLIAFHDIKEHATETKCEVKIFWDKLKETLQPENYCEMIADDGQPWAGIGVVKHVKHKVDEQ